MKQRLCNVLAGVSLLLLALVGWGWVRSFILEDVRVFSSRGYLVFVFSDGDMTRHVDTYHFDRGSPDYLGPDSLWYWLPTWNAPTEYSFLWVHYYRLRSQAGYSLAVLGVPYPWLALAAAVGPAGWYLARRRLRRRARLNQCLHCGYDLRASGERCPECGAPVPAPTSTPAAAPGPAAPTDALQKDAA